MITEKSAVNPAGAAKVNIIASQLRMNTRYAWRKRTVNNRIGNPISTLPLATHEFEVHILECPLIRSYGKVIYSMKLLQN